ncbi:MAG TPA: DUF389 domain-containing protein, partial [Allosphingosinicella sp.]|nr:DUF389 domain-containing protein [Allosphingosinicella sp.]
AWSTHYLFMTLMSAGIAVLGLLLSSPAVVIGAMLISPLMGPIMGIGFALATFDSAELRRTALTMALGIVLAVGFCALIVLLSPLKSVTGEIAARTRPNLFDFLVALFSGLAGSYAMIRGRHGTIVGVAIATAIMPPLAVVGFGVATLNSTVLLGSALLFFTNLMTIAVTAAVLARIYGFAANLSPRQTGLQATLIVATLGALAVPLAFSLQRIAWEALASRQAHELVGAHFGQNARISQVEVDYDAKPLAVEATVFTPRYREDAERVLGERLALVLRQPVEVKIEQFTVGSEQGEAEATQIAAARGATSEATMARLAERLALVAGVPADKVLIDRARSRAVVTAAPLPGADLSSYRSLETRVASADPRWTITLIPPAVPLPEVSFGDGEDGEADQEAIATAIWGARRLNLPVGVGGGTKARADRVVDALRQAGVDARSVAEGERGGKVRLRWLAPDGAAAPLEPGSR